MPPRTGRKSKSRVPVVPTRADIVMLVAIAIMLTGMIVAISVYAPDVLPYYFGERGSPWGFPGIVVWPVLSVAVALDIGVVIGLVSSIRRRLKNR